MMAERKEKAVRRSALLEPNAAGIDIGAQEIYVAVPPDRDEHSTRRFTSFTCDLQALADWLQGCRIRTVAMESTGVLLDPALSDFGAAGLGGIPGQRSLSEERSWPQKRCFRLSVDPVSAFSWFIAGQLPPTRCHLRRTQSVAASQQSAADDF
jgi:hypothetical protein